MQDRFMTIRARIDLLLKNSYSTNDIMLLEGCSYSTANRIKKVCRKCFDGFIKGEINRNRIKAESYWKYLGTTADEELLKIKKLLKEKDYEDLLERK